MSKKRKGNAAESGPTISHWAMGGACLVAVAVAAWSWFGKSYPETTSADGLKLIRALYTACSSRNEARLSRVEKEVAKLDTQGKLSEAERAAFGSIIEQAQTGDWETAIDQSYQFAQDQVR